MNNHYSLLKTWLIILLLLPLAAMAQKMKVESMLSTIDQTANLAENLHKDNNGEYGGLVKVKIASASAEFDGWILEQKKYKPSEFWVFMAKGSRHISVYAEGYLPLEVRFSDFGIEGIKSMQTYALTILLPQQPQRITPVATVDVSAMTASQINKLGEDFLWGYNGKKEDNVEALRLFRLAADQGHARAQANLGQMFAYGLGMQESDGEEAMRLFRLAADQDDAMGQMMLGYMYRIGYGVK